MTILLDTMTIDEKRLWLTNHGRLWANNIITDGRESRVLSTWYASDGSENIQGIGKDRDDADGTLFNRVYLSLMRRCNVY